MQRTAPCPVFQLRVATTFNFQPCALSGAVADLVSRYTPRAPSTGVSSEARKGRI